jgi:hypothetical protein
MMQKVKMLKLKLTDTNKAKQSVETEQNAEQSKS